MCKFVNGRLVSLESHPFLNNCCHGYNTTLCLLYKRYWNRANICHKWSNSAVSNVCVCACVRACMCACLTTNLACLLPDLCPSACRSSVMDSFISCVYFMAAAGSVVTSDCRTEQNGCLTWLFDVRVLLDSIRLWRQVHTTCHHHSILQCS